MKIKMLVKRTEVFEVVADPKDFMASTETLQDKFEFITSVKDDFINIAKEDTVGRWESCVEWELQEFKVEE